VCQQLEFVCQVEDYLLVLYMVEARIDGIRVIFIDKEKNFTNPKPVLTEKF